MSTPSPPQHPDLLVSDREREEHVDLLRRHAGQGRLTVDELDQRTESAYAARTRRELAAVLTDLPAQPDPTGPPPTRSSRAGRRAAFAPYLAVNLLLIAVWALTGAGYFWPIWPLLGWGIGIASHAGRGGPRRPALLPGCHTAMPTRGRPPVS